MLFLFPRHVSVLSVALAFVMPLAAPGAWAAKAPQKHALQETYPAMEEGSVAIQVKESSSETLAAGTEESSDALAASSSAISSTVPSDVETETSMLAAPQTSMPTTPVLPPANAAPNLVLSSPSERAANARIREADLARKRKTKAPDAAHREAARQAMRKAKTRSERGLAVQSAGTVAAPEASALEQRLEQVNHEVQAIREELTSSQRGGERGAYEPVPSEKRDYLARRLQVIERLIREHGRAYDYRIHTTAELEKILHKLEQPVSEVQEETTSDAL